MIRLPAAQHVNELVALMGLKSLRPELPVDDIKIHYVNLDTRTFRSEPGVVFFAHRGKNHNSHAMLKQIPSTVAVVVLEYEVDLPEHLSDVPVFLAPFGMQSALNDWAMVQRRKFQGQVVGITGSNGKTIVKEWLAQLLLQGHRVYKSPGSYNSELGVALSLIQMDLTAEWALIEAGISNPGDMERLQRLILPNFGVFTHWGIAHVEHFGGSRKAILNEKLNLFKGKIPWVGPIEIMEAAEFTAELSRPLFTTGNTAKADVWFNVQGEKHIVYPEGILSLPLDHWTGIDQENALTLVAALKLLGLKPLSLQGSLLQLESLPMRLRTLEGRKGRLLLDDSYSMDEEALFLAVQKLQLLAGNRPKTIVLSDFSRENEDQGFYTSLLERLRLNGFERFVGIGEKWIKRKEAASSDCYFFKTLEEAKGKLDEIIPEQSAVLIKGGRKARLEELVDFLKMTSHRSQLTVSVSAVIRNLSYFKSKLPEGVKLMVMVKAANYGIGYRELPILLQNYGVDYFGVAFPDEGIALRKLGIKIPIMVLNAQAAEFGLLQSYDLQPELYSISMLKAWIEFVASNKQGHIPGCHLKVNTGMNRLGINPEEVSELQNLFTVLPEKFKLVSVFSHLMASGNPEKDSITRWQVGLFSEACSKIAAWNSSPFLKHVANSDAQERFPEFQFDMARLGIGLYAPQYPNQPLEEALKLSSYILQLRNVKAEEYIGYGADFTVKNDTRVAVVAIGYADGFKRILSRGQGKVLIHGHICPVLGNICMDLTMIDVSEIPENKLQVGDEVTVFGPGFPLWQHARQAKTISYEILTSVASRLPRIFVYD
jgi:Alr-MurF fusion protein